jgi:peptidoglycan hydrolase-like amidase
MSQWGAFSMAYYHNKTFEDIIHFYFTGVNITRTIAYEQE